MPPEITQEQAVEDRNRMLATLMEEWSPLQRDLMAWLLSAEEDPTDIALAIRYDIDPSELRRQRSLARARLHEAFHLRASAEAVA